MDGEPQGKPSRLMRGPQRVGRVGGLVQICSGLLPITAGGLGLSAPPPSHLRLQPRRWRCLTASTAWPLCSCGRMTLLVYLGQPTVSRTKLFCNFPLSLTIPRKR